MSKLSYFLLFLLLIQFMSCDNSEYITSVNINDRVPIGITKDFEMIYTDSMKTRSLIKAPVHQDFSNHPINYFEFIDGIFASFLMKSSPRFCFTNSPTRNCL